MTDSPSYLDQIEEILGYKFDDRRLLEEAFIHPSCPRVLDTVNPRLVSYERLEFVGVSVLNMMIAKEMFLLYPDIPPGELTRLRAANVQTEKLARVAMKHGLYKYLSYKDTGIDQQIKDFEEAILEYPVNSNGQIQAPKFLAHVVAATVGAISIDRKFSIFQSNSSLHSVWTVYIYSLSPIEAAATLKFIKELLQPLINMETVELQPCTKFQELCQKKKWEWRYDTNPKEEDNTCTRVTVEVNGIPLGTGIHTSSEIARNRAAKNALDNINSGRLVLDFLHTEVLDRKMKITKEVENELLMAGIPRSLAEVEKILGYKFSDKNLLEEAFSYRTSSYKNNINMDPCKKSYQRLEFIGDAVVNMLLAIELYSLYPDIKHGQLNRLKSANVDNEKLARVAIKHGFYDFLRNKTTHLEEQVQKFATAVLDFPVYSNGLIAYPKFLADLVEAIIGAVFIDSNFSLDTVRKMIKVLLMPMIRPDTLKVHPKTELQQFCDKNNLKVRTKLEPRNEKENTRTFHFILNNNVVGTGTHAATDIAENWAAKDALEKLKTNLATKSL